MPRVYWPLLSPQAYLLQAQGQRALFQPRVWFSITEKVSHKALEVLCVHVGVGTVVLLRFSPRAKHLKVLKP